MKLLLSYLETFTGKKQFGTTTTRKVCYIFVEKYYQLSVALNNIFRSGFCGLTHRKSQQIIILQRTYTVVTAKTAP